MSTINDEKHQGEELEKEDNVMAEKEKKRRLTVDIIIPAYRPDHKFDLLMKRLRKQSYQPEHIIILNTIPRDVYEEVKETQKDEFMQKYREINRATVIHIPEDEFDHGGTRAYGASLSHADLIMYMTHDAVPADEFLIEELVNAFEDPEVGASYARQLPYANADEIEQYTRKYNYPTESRVKSKADMKKLGVKTFFCSDVCAMYRKSIYEELGGFVTKTIFNEDMIFSAKLIDSNYKIAYVAQARVYHSHQYSYRQQLRRNFDLAVSQVQYKEVFENVSSESEGIRLVKQTIKYLLKRHSYFKVVDLVLMSGFKYIGYFLGKHYQLLPKKWVVKISMNKNYWK